VKGWCTEIELRFRGRGHRIDFKDLTFDSRRQLAELDYGTSSHAASQSLAENHVGLPMEW